MKKTIVILMVLGAALAGCKKSSSTESTETLVNDPAGVYTLVTVDGVKVPGTFSHGQRKVMMHSGSFIINADNTCVSKTVFGSQQIAREVKATYTQNGSTLNMQWIGAGKTKGTIKGDTFTMNNEGMIFLYKKQP